MKQAFQTQRMTNTLYKDIKAGQFFQKKVCHLQTAYLHSSTIDEPTNWQSPLVKGCLHFWHSKNCLHQCRDLYGSQKLQSESHCHHHQRPCTSCRPDLRPLHCNLHKLAWLLFILLSKYTNTISSALVKSLAGTCSPIFPALHSECCLRILNACLIVIC